MTMRIEFQPGRSAQRPTWLRLVGVLCLLLICIASTAQVCHTHLEVAASSKDSQDSHQNVPAPDHCPLCVAMHSALPATANAAPEPLLQVQAVLFRAVELQRLQRWSFDLFSRPPPAMPSVA
jgi:hypothetical protein